ncbi:MAG: hypothetical protein MR350_02710 [Alphaproteobacteria bacterium]|nr:hypothetical protein [Alphaproteobacteria bacterium]
MEKFIVNKLVEEYTNLMFGLIQHIDYFSPLRTEGEAEDRYNLTETIEALDLVPAGWKKQTSGFGYGFVDSSGNMIFPFVRNKKITFDLLLWKDKRDGSENTKNLCFELFNNMLQPLHGSLFLAGLWRTNHPSEDLYYYGDKYCGAKKKCLRSATMSDIQSICNSCSSKEENCISVWELDNT